MKVCFSYSAQPNLRAKEFTNRYGYPSPAAGVSYQKRAKLQYNEMALFFKDFRKAAIDILLRWSKDLHPIGFRDAVNMANATHIKGLLTPAA